MSTLNVNNIATESGSTITIGGSGDTVTLGSGASSSGFGAAVAGIAGVSTFTSSGTWTKATREAALGVTIKRVIVYVTGGGGSASASQGGNYSAGGAGTAIKLIDVSSISSATVTVGSGGAGVHYSPAQSGNNGGDSIWSDGTNTVTGGGGGRGIYNGGENTGLGGTATGGDININGGNAPSLLYGQAGGSYWGSGGVRRDSTQSFSTRGAYGSGGTSIYDGQSIDAPDGIVIVWEIAG